jgi:protease-4
MRTFGKITLWSFAILGGLTFSIILAIMVFSLTARDKAPPAPENALLSLDWNEEMAERHVTLSPLKRVPSPTVLDTVTALERAAEMPGVKALEVRLGDAPIGYARAQELAAAVRTFRASGKKAYVFATDLAAMGDGTPETLLASAFDEVWMAPSGMVGLTGVALEVPFVADGLEEIGIRVEAEQRHEFKGGADPLIRDRMSPAVRGSLQSVADGLLRQTAEAIAADRDLPLDAVLGLIDTGPHLAREALAAGLVDRLDYATAFDAMLDERYGADTPRLGAGRILASEPDETDTVVVEAPPRVAVLYGVGAIGADGEGFGDPGFDADGLVETLADIARNGGYDAVLFRVDSPGGAYGPSDAVWHAVKSVKDAGIPVVVSMADTAASGGYFVSAAADRIVAHPATVTGSIGVYSLTLNTAGLWENLGVRWEYITAGENAGMFSATRGFDAAERARFAASVDFVYEDFTRKVAEGRSLDQAELNAAARGRIWLGAAAVDAGLVDRLGGFPEAFAEIRDLLDVDAGTDLDLTVLPAPKSAIEAILEAAQSGEFSLALGDWVAAEAERRVVDRLGERLGNLNGFETPAGLLAMPPIRLRP